MKFLDTRPKNSSCFLILKALYKIEMRQTHSLPMSPLTTPPSPSDIEAGKTWIVEMYRVADTKGIASVIEFLSQDATVYMGNTCPIRGRPAIERLCLWESAACSSISHRINHIDVRNDQTLVTLVADYLFTNGVKKTAECSVIWYKRPTDNIATRSDIRGDLAEVVNEVISIQGPPNF
ncbi:hypothetical protein FPV67DRAFT_1017384 [Lyophyllum atratum]|nr:hypothetical protein FPV67DRAFT_1017384 [Lyophyllum atratum]